MFLEQLSSSLLRICDTEHLSYEQAAEYCDCSARHFANIVRRRSYPSLKVFEQICTGLHQSPNRLLGVELDEFSFRVPMPVVAIRAFPPRPGSPSLPVCPQCGSFLAQERPAYCSNCGQCLSWKHFKTTPL